MPERSIAVFTLMQTITTIGSQGTDQTTVLFSLAQPPDYWPGPEELKELSKLRDQRRWSRQEATPLKPDTHRRARISDYWPPPEELQRLSELRDQRRRAKKAAAALMPRELCRGFIGQSCRCKRKCHPLAYIDPHPDLAEKWNSAENRDFSIGSLVAGIGPGVSAGKEPSTRNRNVGLELKSNLETKAGSAGVSSGHGHDPRSPPRPGHWPSPEELDRLYKLGGQWRTDAKLAPADKTEPTRQKASIKASEIEQRQSLTRSATRRSVVHNHVLANLDGEEGVLDGYQLVELGNEDVLMHVDNDGWVEVLPIECIDDMTKTI